MKNPQNPQNWFHVEGLGVTFDLNRVTAIVWNYRSRSSTNTKFITKVFLVGMAAVYGAEANEALMDEWWLYFDSDRQALYAALFPDGCQITLKLNSDDR